MISETPTLKSDLENISTKKRVKLSRDEKDHIERIATALGKDVKEVQEVFLALVAYITLNMYEGKDEFVIPYLFKVRVKSKKVVIPKGFELQEEYKVESSIAFHDIISKLQSGQTTWIEEFCKVQLYQNLNSKLND